MDVDSRSWSSICPRLRLHHRLLLFELFPYVFVQLLFENVDLLVELVVLVVLRLYFIEVCVVAVAVLVAAGEPVAGTILPLAPPTKLLEVVFFFLGCFVVLPWKVDDLFDQGLLFIFFVDLLLKKESLEQPCLLDVHVVILRHLLLLLQRYQRLQHVWWLVEFFCTIHFVHFWIKLLKICLPPLFLQILWYSLRQHPNLIRHLLWHLDGSSWPGVRNWCRIERGGIHRWGVARVATVARIGPLVLAREIIVVVNQAAL